MAGQTLGYALAALQYGYVASIPSKQRSIGEIKGYVTFEETHTDDLEITDHPIEQGALISDHAFKRPAEVTLKVGWSNSPGGGGLLGGVLGAVNTIGIATSALLGGGVNQVDEIYQQLLKLQESRTPFEVFTGKRFYENMLVKSLIVTTDKNTENILQVTAVLRQVILVTTTTLQLEKVPAANQAEPQVTQPTTNSGSKQLAPPTKINQSAAEQAISPR